LGNFTTDVRISILKKITTLKKKLILKNLNLTSLDVLSEGRIKWYLSQSEVKNMSPSMIVHHIFPPLFINTKPNKKIFMAFVFISFVGS